MWPPGTLYLIMIEKKKQKQRQKKNKNKKQHDDAGTKGNHLGTWSFPGGNQQLPLS